MGQHVWLVIESYYAETHLHAAYLAETDARAAADEANRRTWDGKYEVVSVPLGAWLKDAPW